MDAQTSSRRSKDHEIIHRSTIRDTVAFIGMLINAAGLVWGAAKLSASVDSLKETTTEFKATLVSVTTKVTNLEIRTAVIESKQAQVSPIQ